MKRYLLAAGLLVLVGAAFAQAQMPSNYMGRAGGVTNEVCVSPTVTAGAYVAGQSVGGLITMPGALLPSNAGRLYSIRLTTKSVQTVEFDVTVLASLPVTTFTDHAAPAINAADVGLVQPPIKLTNNFSGLGTHTVYGADNVNRGVKGIGTSMYAVITTPGTPTFASTSDVQLCAAWSQD